MIIDNLPSISLPVQSTDEIPIERGTTTNKVAVSGLMNGVLKTSDVVDNLTSTANNKPLSANMGKTLNDNITKLKGAGSVTENADNMLTTGIYRCVSNSVTNIPTGYNDGTLIVSNNGDGDSTVQTFVSADNVTFRRVTWAYSTINWTAWQELALKSEIPTLIHDQYSGKQLNYKAVAFTTSRAMIFLPPDLGTPTNIEITSAIFPGKGGAGNLSNISITSNDVSFDFSATGVVIGQPAVVLATIVW